MKSLKFVYFFSFIVIKLQAQIFTMKNCAEIVLKNNLDLKQVLLNIESAKLNQNLAKNAAFPSVNGNANYGYQFGRGIDPGSNTFIDKQIGSSFLSIDANLVLYNFGRINEAKKQQNINLEATNFEKEDIKNNVLLSLVQAFSQVLFQKEINKIAINQVNTTKSDAERTQKLVSAGIQTELNLINLKAKLANDELSMINSENQLRISKLNLIQLMNLPANEIDLEKFDIETPELTSIENNIILSSSEIYAKAYQNQPSIKNSLLKINAAEKAHNSNKAAKYPTLSLSASLNSRFSSALPRFDNFGRVINYPYPNQIIDNFAQSIFLNLNVPIFGNYRLRGNEQNAIINKERAKIALENISNQLRKKIETAQTEYIVAQKRLNSLENLKLANEESLKATQKRFDVGMANSVELVLAQNNLFKSNSDLIQQKFDLYLKQKVLSFYLNNEISY
ncbi:MAG: TolC family protein [Cytophagales bacterium]|nr:MAG: TolC family protein [Cytophagales bacterium]